MDELNIKKSRMEQERDRRHLDQIHAERMKMEQQAESENIKIRKALLSNVKALTKLSENIKKSNKSNGTVTTSGLASNYSKTMAKNTEIMVKHAVSQVNFLKSIDRSLFKVTALLKPQFRIFEKNIDALMVKVLDKKPVRVFQDMVDPRRSPFKKALDTIFGAQAPAQEVYVQNWREIKEGASRTRTDLLGRVGQLLSTGLIGNITGLGGAFARGSRYETRLQQHKRIMTEMRQGGDPSKIMARESSATKMSEIEKLYSGAGGNAATINFAAVLAMATKSGRKDLTDVFSDMFTQSYNDSVAMFRTSLRAGSTGLYGTKDSKLLKEFSSIRDVAQKNTGYSRSKFKSESMSSAFSDIRELYNTGKLENKVNNIIKKRANISDIKKTVGASSSSFIDSTSNAVKSSFDSLNKILSKAFSTARVKSMAKSVTHIIKMSNYLKVIKNNSNEIVKLLRAGNFGGTGTGTGTTTGPKSRWQRVKDKWNDRESFRLTNKMGNFQKLSGIAFGGIKAWAALKTAIVKGKIQAGIWTLGKIFGRIGKGSFQLSGIGGEGIAKAGKGLFGLGKLGAKGVSKIFSGTKSAVGKVIGPDSFRLRKAKKKKRQERKNENLILKIYKLLNRRLPNKREWKKIGGGGKKLSTMGGMLKGMLTNPAVLLGMTAAITTGVAAKRITDTFQERGKQKKMMAENKAVNAKSLAKSNERTRNKFGATTEDLIALNEKRKKAGLKEIPTLGQWKALRDAGHSGMADFTEEELNAAKESAYGKPAATMSSASSPVIPAKGKTVATNPKIAASSAIASNENSNLENMKQFLLNEFTNNLVMNLAKVGGNMGTDKITKIPSQLNVFS